MQHAACSMQHAACRIQNAAVTIWIWALRCLRSVHLHAARRRVEVAVDLPQPLSDVFAELRDHTMGSTDEPLKLVLEKSFFDRVTELDKLAVVRIGFVDDVLNEDLCI
jgi:hypothetical protein